MLFSSSRRLAIFAVVSFTAISFIGLANFHVYFYPWQTKKEAEIRQFQHQNLTLIPEFSKTANQSKAKHVENIHQPEAAGRSHNPESVLPDFSEVQTAGKFDIPKILHQHWKTADNLPAKYVLYRQTWLKMHSSGWTHHLWTDAENRELVRLHYPWLLEVYDNFPVGVMRSDLCRYLQLHKYGGMYADLDMEPLRPLDFLFENASQPVILGYMRDTFNDISNIPPALMISQRGHEFWMTTARHILQSAKTMRKSSRPDYVTGPVALFRSIQLYEQQLKTLASVTKGSSVVGDIRVLEPGLLYPYHWSEGKQPQGKVCNGQAATQNETACKAMYPNAYTIQYSSFSWGKDWENFLNSHGFYETVQ